MVSCGSGESDYLGSVASGRGGSDNGNSSNSGS
jgi:hypothetical protein